MKATFGDPVNPDPDEVEQALFNIERRSPFETTEIALRVALSPALSSKLSHFAIRFDPGDVLLEQRGANYWGQLALMFAFYQQGFLKRASTPIRIDVNLTPAQFNQALKDGIDVSQDVAISTEIEKIRVMIFDRRLFSLGSVTVPSLK